MSFSWTPTFCLGCSGSPPGNNRENNETEILSAAFVGSSNAPPTVIVPSPFLAVVHLLNHKEGSPSGNRENNETEILSAALGGSSNAPPTVIVPWPFLAHHRVPRLARIQKLCVPMYKAAIEGNWKMAKQYIKSDDTIKSAQIAYGSYTALHVAAGSRRVQFVEELMKMIDPCDLTTVLRLQDGRGNTAFSAAAAAGSLEIAKIMMQHDPSLQEELGGEGKTPLYIATLFGHKKMASCLYSQPPVLGEDLCGVFFTCINTGLYGLAFIILNKNPHFALERNDDSLTALHLLAQKPSAFTFKTPGVWMRWKRCLALEWIRHCPELFDGQLKTILQLLSQNHTRKPFWKRLKLYFASKALENYPELILERDGKDLIEAFHSLAEPPTRVFQQRSLKMAQSPALALVEALWDYVVKSSRFSDILTSPTHLLFDAVKSGNSGFVALLLRSYPALIWEKDGENEMTIIHAAISLRHVGIFKLIHGIGMFKDVIVTFKDKNKNTMLHLAAQAAPEHELNKVFGASFQMQRELQWFKEVKKIMPPSYIEMKNSDNKTAQEIFSSVHRPLQKDAEKWMNETARSCMVVSTLVVSALFAAGITAFMKDESVTSSDHHWKKASFRAFIISDIIAFFLSLSATVMFLYILTSRYAEREFLEDLPSKLIAGLVLLFLSIIAMIVSFSAAFLMAYARHDVLPAIIVITVIPVCSLLPVVLFTLPIVNDFIASTLNSKSLFKKSN